MSWEFAEDKKKSAEKKSPELQWAEQLYNALAKKRKANRFNARAWSNEFCSLFMLDKRSQQEITQVLDWYCKHIGEEYVPEAYDAKSFRKKFLSIQKQSNKSIDKKVDLSDKAMILYKEFKDKKWPSMLHMQLRNIIQTSIDNYIQYWRKAKSLRDQLKAKVAKGGPFTKEKVSDSKQLALLENVIGSGHLCPPVSFIRAWISGTQEMYENFNQWDGDPTNIMFSANNPKMIRWMCLWAYNWCNDGEKGLKLHERISNTTEEE